MRNPDAVVTFGDLWAFAEGLAGVDNLPATPITAEVQHWRTGHCVFQTSSPKTSTTFSSPTGLLKPFPLLRLPAELRNIIYGLAISTGKTFTIASACHPDDIQPLISKISREVRLEALPIFYTENEFDFHAFRHNFDHLLQYLTFVYCWAIMETNCIHITIRQTTWGEQTKDQNR
ncbi:hypothetical protein LTS10_011926 [Elasticomyces elasticus]|nr:hypothetical protein LTS10_011926 [Elasticomyces elasticus]